MAPVTEVRGIRMIGISGEVSNGMWDYNTLDLPGVTLPPVAIEPLTTIADQGYAIDSLRLTSLSGTYLETPGHMVATAPLLDQMPVERFVRPARIMRLPPAAPYTLYGIDDFTRHDPGISDGDALIIDTGWGRYWNSPDYLTKAPAFAMSTLDWLVAQPFSLLAADTPVMECLWADKVDPPITSEIGKAVLGELYQRRQSMLLLGPLVNLDQIDGNDGTLIALPANITNVCAAPCRAVFLEGLRLSADGGGSGS